MTENYNEWVLWIIAFIVAFFLIKNITDKQNAKNKIDDIKQKEKILKDEMIRRNKILERVEHFIKGAKFIEPIATWKGVQVYRYIFNSGKLYEFDDFMPESNQRVGIDDEYLCFKRICYKRVDNTIPFIDKFGSVLKGSVNELVV